MAIVESTGFSHVRITVSDIERSRAFYDQVFGWEVAADQSAKAGQPGMEESPEDLYGGVVYQTPQGTLFGLRPISAAGTFDADTAGLDHVSFAVSSRDDLVQAAEALTEAGIKHGEILDLDDMGMAILSIQDPDDINVELTAPLS